MFWATIAVLVILYFSWKFYLHFTYWKKRGVPQGGFGCIFRLTLQNVVRNTSIPEMVNNEYKLFPKSRYNGSYQLFTPTLIVRDPELLKQITVKDFDHFTDHQQFVTEDAEPLWGKNLFSLTGEKWREMRATLSPSFTSSKMRSMFTLISECAERFTDHFVQNAKETNEVEMKDIFTRYTNDVIATSAFGIKCDSLGNRTNEFYLMGRKATNFKGLLLLGMRMFTTDVANFFTNLIRETIEVREKHGIVRPDMIHLLLEARKGHLKYEEQKEAQNETGFATVEESKIGTTNGGQKKAITDEDIAAQAFIFFLAGFDTAATTMSFMAYELAVNPDIQKKLHHEITQTLNLNQKLTYEEILKMQYLDMVVSETLRKYPPGVAADRLCVKPYQIEPVGNKKPFLVDKGVIVVIPQYGFHRDEKYYPNPERFDPERFNEDNKKNIQPYTYMPFGIGPRNCIGSRFALLEVKAVFVQVLSKFEIVVTEKTQVPLQFCTKSLSMAAESGFWLGLKLRSK